MLNEPRRPARVGGDADDPMLAPRYMDIATFMRAPLVRDPSAVDIALIGVPFDGGVTNREIGRAHV